MSQKRLLNDYEDDGNNKLNNGGLPQRWARHEIGRESWQRCLVTGITFLYALVIRQEHRHDSGTHFQEASVYLNSSIAKLRIFWEYVSSYFTKRLKPLKIRMYDDKSTYTSHFCAIRGTHMGALMLFNPIRTQKILDAKELASLVKRERPVICLLLRFRSPSAFVIQKLYSLIALSVQIICMSEVICMSPLVVPCIPTEKVTLAFR